MTLPAPGVSLEELQALTGQLLMAGAEIGELNTVRKHLDLIKGGGLAGCTSGAQILALVLSDVAGDALDVIASGPTVADPSTFADARAVLEKYGLWQGASNGIRIRFQDGVDGKIAETLKPGDDALLRVANIIIGSNQLAVKAAAAQARHEGFEVQIDPSPLLGEARLAGEHLTRWAQDASKAKHSSPLCRVCGGETTVTVTGSGQGGRNQELALAAVSGLSDVPGALLVTLATDGGDGTTPAAGAAATSDTLSKARSLGLDPQDYLDRNDSHSFFALLDELLVTGPTLTNVNDLALIIIP
jgi:hydroxypyruvate reductase